MDNSAYQSRSLKCHNWSLFQIGTEKHIVHVKATMTEMPMEFMMECLFIYLSPPVNLLPEAGTKLQCDTSHSMPLLPKFYNINAVVFIYCMQSNLFVGFFEKHTCMS